MIEILSMEFEISWKGFNFEVNNKYILLIFTYHEKIRNRIIIVDNVWRI